MRFLLITGLLLSITACASYEEHFNVGHQEYQDANAECRYLSWQNPQGVRYAYAKTFNDCLYVKGFQKYRWP